MQLYKITSLATALGLVLFTLVDARCYNPPDSQPGKGEFMNDDRRTLSVKKGLEIPGSNSDRYIKNSISETFGDLVAPQLQ
jgi:hypothetical protein